MSDFELRRAIKVVDKDIALYLKNVDKIKENFFDTSNTLTDRQKYGFEIRENLIEMRESVEVMIDLLKDFSRLYERNS